MGIAEEVGAALYEAARLSPWETPKRGAATLAARIYGESIIYMQPRSIAEATVATINGAPRIVLRRGTSPARANFLIGQMLGRMALAAMGRSCLETELQIGAWVVAPPARFCARMHQVGVDVPALAEAFCITQTCASMRLQEVGGPDAVVTTPQRVYRRGSLLRWVGDEDVRKIAAAPSPRSVRRVVLRDEPGRVALLAKSA